MFSRWLAGGKNLLWPVALALIFYFGYIWRLGSLLPGASGDEISNMQFSSNLNSIWHYPTNAPYNLVQHLLLKLDSSSIAAGRLTSATFIAISAVCLYYTMKSWFGRPTAFFTAVIFLSLPYTVILGRTATPRVLTISLVALSAAFTLVIKAERKLVPVWIAVCTLCGLSLYIPGMVWFLFVGLFLSRQQLRKFFLELPKKAAYGGLAAGIILLVPLILSLVSGRTPLREWLLLPRNWGGLVDTIKYLGWSFSSIFVKTPAHTDYILGRSPLLPAATVVLALFGIYGLSQRLRQAAYILSALAMPALLLFAINLSIDPLYFTLPLFILLSGVGIRFLYLEWRVIFPRNPLPRYLALFLMALVLGSSTAYGLRSSLIAWPHNPAIRAAYVIK